MNVILCGLPGSGKSTVGKLLAQMLKRKHFETDHELESHYEGAFGEKLSCRQIFQKMGDKPFRELEKQILLKFQGSSTIIDIGGGTLTNEENARIIKSLGLVIYMKNDRDAVYQRLMKKGLPAYLDAQEPYESFIKLAEAREPLYEQTAHTTIECAHLAPQEIVDLIVKLEGVK